MRKKRSFLLIEVMMAIALLAIALPPLIKGFHQIYHCRAKRCERIGMELLGKESLSDLKELLYQGKCRWDFSKKVKGELAPIDSCSLFGQKKRVFQRVFISTPMEKYKKKETDSRFLLCKVEIFLMEGDKERASFTYPLFLIQELSS